MKRAVESVLSQTFRDFELIVVDDGSEDGTAGMLGEYGAMLSVCRQEHSGVSAARNRGINLSRGDHIAFLDSDDEWYPEKLEAQRTYMINHPGIRLHQCDEIWIRKGQRVNPMDKHRKREGDIFLESLRLCLISPSAAVMRRDLIEECGLFDEHMTVCEDYDLWLRITCREEVGFLPEKLVKKYGGHEDQLSRSFWGMDRFRVYSIIKLLQGDGGMLKAEYRNSAREVAQEKCRILLNGAGKRGKKERVAALERVRDLLDRGSYSSIDPAILLEE